MTKKAWGITCLALVTFLLVLLSWAPAQYVVPILMYHTDSHQSAEPLNNVCPETFVRQMDFLKKYGYKVIALEDLVKGIKAGHRFAFNTVVITFDDGYVDNYTTAYPILKARSFPATMFIPSDKIGTKGRLNWQQVREMAVNGITIASHTRWHTYLPDDDHMRVVDEIVGSKRIIEKQIGKRVDFIAYPVGGFTEEAKQIARDAGYLAAFTTNRGTDKYNKDLFELKRIRVKDSDNWYILLGKLSGYYNFFRSRKSLY